MPNPASNDSHDATSHDKLFKALFRSFLKDLVELIHPELAMELELDRPHFVGESLFAHFRRQGHVEPDLVAEARTRDGEPRLVLVHVETEARFRRSIDQRMLRYGLHLILESGKPVVSVVVFLSGGTPGIEIREVRQQVGPFEPLCFRYFAFGLSGSLAETYVDRPQPLAAALAALMRSAAWDRAEKKLRCLRAISQAEDLGIRQRYLLAKVVDTYVQLTADEEDRFAQAVAQEANEEIRNMIVTWEEALAERETRGEARGAVKAAQEADLRAARRRFGTLPPDFEEKIRATHDLDRLYQLLDRILEVRSVEDLDQGS